MIHFAATPVIAQQRRTELEATAARSRQLRQARQADAPARRWTTKRLAVALPA
jgi:hypothetical protein